MTIDEIREQIASALAEDAQEQWYSILDDTSPGHYGLEDFEVEIESRNVWVDIPSKTFSFKNIRISFTARLGASSEEHGLDTPFNKVVSGEGKFDFTNAATVKVETFHLSEPIDLFDYN